MMIEGTYPLGRQLSMANENAWLALGKISEILGDDDTTIKCYEKSLLHNHMNSSTIFNLACYYEKREEYNKGCEHFRTLVSMNNTNGDAWSHLGFCLVQLNDLSNAYTAYQHALYHVSNPGRDPSLWYGIGLLYERYGSLDFAEDTFQAVIKMDPPNDICWESKFRLGIISKHRGKYDDSLDRLHYIIEQTNNRDDKAAVWSEIGSVHELKNEINLAKKAYEKVIELCPNNVKAYQQLGWLCLKTQTDITNAIDYLKQAVATDPKDGKGWYLLGRCYMTINECEEAYYAYKEALALDANNPNIWCSLGVLFYQLGQYLDALDAYSRAINANPNICEVWYNVGTLYDTCNQTGDARDAYQKAAELGADTQFIRERLEMLRAKETGQSTGNNTTNNNTPPPSEPPTTAPMQSSKIINIYNGSLPGQLTATPATANSQMPNRRIGGLPPPTPIQHLTIPLSGSSIGDLSTPSQTQQSSIPTGIPSVTGNPRHWMLAPGALGRSPLNPNTVSHVVRNISSHGQNQQPQQQTSQRQGIGSITNISRGPISGMIPIQSGQQGSGSNIQNRNRGIPILSQQGHPTPIQRKLTPEEIKRYNEERRIDSQIRGNDRRGDRVDIRDRMPIQISSLVDRSSSGHCVVTQMQQQAQQGRH